jgi:hypothetical protein
MGEYDLLNERQKAQADGFVELALEYGQFDQSSNANGAHYAAENPFVAEGLKCGNCVFYNEANGCQIVAGVIDPEAVCKLWIIPQATLDLAQARSRLNKLVASYTQ